ncbi:hypothetical protein SAMN05414137_12437 [Streptacidiphilus jiangxiensis]|uniref:Phytanoyl-CoA dioxygenase (PhyH) n=1 Tax=Streptacidiphilus jiangxiensis TaxID=235985 RepID=A0A1H7XI80_STRJI|nr:hypothetical protein SAMN05414137_12437 [Streptacidiphilus jiangxiensis]
MGDGRIPGLVALEAARLYWGNDAWHENNRGQQRVLARSRSVPAVPADAAGHALATAADRNGFAVLDPGYRPGLIEEVRAGYEKLIDDPTVTVDMGGRIKDAVRYVLDPVDRVPVLRELLNAPVLSALDAYYGGRWRVQHVRMWRIAHLPEHERGFHHYGNLWHCDQHPTSTLKYFVQISEGVTAEGGAFRLHPVPSTRRLMRSGFLGQGWAKGPARRQLDDPRRVVPFVAPAGHGAFVNTTRCLHRAGNPPEGTTRGMVQLTFVPAPDPRGPGDPLDGLRPDPNVAEGRTA